MKMHLLEESFLEKLASSKSFLWFIENKRIVFSFLTAIAILFLGGTLWVAKKSGGIQEEYIKIESNIEKIENALFAGNDQEAREIWQETKPLINQQIFFTQAFQAKFAELLIFLEERQEALSLMEDSLKRTEKFLGNSFLPFIQITKKVVQGDYQSALNASKVLLEEKNEDVPLMLKAYTLLQIPALAKVLGDSKEELASIENIFSSIEEQGEFGKALLLLAETIQSEKTSYLDYLKVRRTAL